MPLFGTGDDLVEVEINLVRSVDSALLVERCSQFADGDFRIAVIRAH